MNIPTWSWRVSRPLYWLVICLILIPLIAPAIAVIKAFCYAWSAFFEELRTWVCFYTSALRKEFWTEAPKTKKQRRIEAANRMFNRKDKPTT